MGGNPRPHYAAWRNPHTVANAARFRQQNQPKPKWDNKKPNQNQGKPQGSGSGSGPGSGQNQNKQQSQQKKECEQQSDGQKKKRTRSRKKKQGNEASTASIEEVKDTSPDYSASSAIASMAWLTLTSTRAKIDEMKSRFVPLPSISDPNLSRNRSPRLGNHTISGEEFFFFPDGNMIDLSPPDTDIDSWTLPRLCPTTRNLLLDESDVDLDPSDSGSISQDPRKCPFPRHSPTPYERGKTKALFLWDQRLNAVTVTAPPIEDGAGQVGGNAPAVKMPATKGKEVEKMEVDKVDEVSLGNEDGEFEYEYDAECEPDSFAQVPRFSSISQINSWILQGSVVRRDKGLVEPANLQEGSGRSSRV
ncbi:hypothetical protein AGABI1DRAFT_128225 [Agaricus bisporus var. burnettii JB137-S8]|uniref:Uncharacterized protein n=1 Tax=Agaricus bisporus var. burnettii (strain JB137-S8 / ATCC MYA-4627 / FGSC 10392) TaxID=597362 RepID=K5XV84_AGABU|nr:uncharacterized protein AGABI1DRAFT_128225 [Agaricus bisporus var. burnettii JB137-S8]EKM79060.1 hypothetical protein AGABI1DRAFT_128225 [Agaricus bisporus var. burnettii JB137-S8]